MKHETSKVLGWVEDGESVQITRRDKIVGVLTPVAKAEAKPESDFYKRLETLFHDSERPLTGTEIVSYARGRE